MVSTCARGREPDERERPLAVGPALVLVRQTVTVSDIRVEAFIGVHGHEKNRRQSLVIAVELEVAAPAEDVIDATIDYNRVVELSRALADEGIGLIETFARRLGEALLADPRALRADVAITKPGALANGVARATATLVRAGAPGGRQ